MRFTVPVLAFVVAILSLNGPARAQSWVQVEAHPTLAEAESRARRYAGDFPDVQGYRLRSGWYAVAIGPFDAATAANRLNALLAERLIPGDSFIADGSRFASQYWPAGGAVAAVPTPDPAPTADTPSPDAGQAQPVAVAEPAPDAADETPAQARQSEARLDGDARRALQTAMQYGGYYASAIDGAIGPGTRRAMADWQADNGFEPTGVLTTGQRARLLAGYQSVIAGLGRTMIRDETAGVEVMLPMALVEQGDYQPPFAQYDARGDSGVQVILISQEGDQATLFGLYDILQTLEIMPLEGDRERRKTSFVLTGSNAVIQSHAEARQTQAGNIKGFILVWPAGDDKRRQLVLAAMRDSFAPIGDTVLPDTFGADDARDIDLLSGLEIRRPALSRSGFYVSDDGMVLTSADAVAGCARLTLDGETEASVVASDAGLGVALVRPATALAPLGVASFQTVMPRLKSEIAVSGYAFDARLGTSVLTFGRLEELQGLMGEPTMARLSLAATPGDAGGPVLDGSGAVMGMLLPPATDSNRQLPADVGFATEATALAEFLSAAGVPPRAAGPDTQAIPPEELTRRALNMTVHVACWN